MREKWGLIYKNGWIMTETDIETQGLIIENIQQELSGGEQTGLRPFRMDGRIKFMQTWVIIMGERTLGEDATPNG